jgi:hypothetical protein
MRTLLGYIGKERQADSLAEKLLGRFQAAAGPAQWRNLAFCLTQARAHACSAIPRCCISLAMTRMHALC